MFDLIRAGARSSRGDAPSRRIGRLTRLLLLLGVLSGLFTMHGLSADHDVAMSAVHNAASGAVSEGMAAHPPVAAQAASATQLATPADAPASDHMPDMAQACVAILTGAAVLALLLLSPLRALLSRWLAIGQPVQRARSRALPPLRSPDLSILCVLRT